MGERKDNMQYIWVAPLIGGIVALLGLLTPAASYSILVFMSSQVWMWGLFSVKTWDIYEGYITVTRFTESPVELVISLIATLIVFIGAIGLLFTANKGRKRGCSELKGVTSSILLIIGTLIWIIGFEVIMQFSTGTSFWDSMVPGFAVIAPFLGAVIALIAYGAAKASSKKPLELITPIRQESTGPQVDIHTPHSFRFCPTCGEKVVNTNQQYCINCGFNFESFLKK